VGIVALSLLCDADAAEGCWALTMFAKLKIMEIAVNDRMIRTLRRKKTSWREGKQCNCALVVRQSQGDSLPKFWRLHNSYALREGRELCKGNDKSLCRSLTHEFIQCSASKGQSWRPDRCFTLTSA
jgi:hypothetical protein